MGKDLKEIVILHSNDIHGRFEGEKDESGRLRHSLAQVSGYVNQAKSLRRPPESTSLPKTLSAF